MTDSNATELRELLDERGVEYDVKDLPNIKFFHDTRWNANGVRWCFTEFVGATTCLTMCNEWKDCTPEQAIAATLGSEREKELEELVRDMWFWGYEGHMDNESKDWQMKHIDGVLDRMKELGVEVIYE